MTDDSMTIRIFHVRPRGLQIPEDHAKPSSVGA